MSSAESAQLTAQGGEQTPSRVRTLLNIMRTTPHVSTRSDTPPDRLDCEFTPLPSLSLDESSLAYIL